MANEVSFRPATGDIPTNPGVYRFVDDNGRVLYVGKAKNLRARLSSYFAPLNTLQEKTRRMVQAAADVNWTIVKSEFEALQLEFTWIKEYDPPFNVRFKDDKSYPYLAITMGEEVPRVLITRNRDRKGTKYYGPYTQSWAIRETMDTLLKVFPMRSCSSGIYKRAEQTNRPCLLADIGKCSAPCVGRIGKEEHTKAAKQFGDFMQSGDETYIETLAKQMRSASAEQKYELAAKLRDDINALETVLEKSTVVFTDQTDADLFGIADDELTAAVSLFRVRGGRIRGARGWVVDKEIERTTQDLVEYLVQNVYEEASGNIDIPKEVLVPELPADHLALAQWLSEKRGAKVDLRVPQRGDKRALAETALTNAKHSLNLYKLKRTSDFTSRSDALAQLQKALQLENAPLRIECFDISHLSGTGIVASMVVFEDGLPKKSQYRKFNIEQSTDDTDSMFQVLTRRLKYLADGVSDNDNKFSYRPGLLVVDGGAPQVNAAKRALEASGISDIAVIGLAKRLEEIWLPNEAFPVILPRATEALFLLQRIRDEAHRFAITAQRKQRKSSIATELGQIEGLGDKRVNALLRRFGSAKRLRLATVAEISEVAGIGPKLAEAIKLQLEQSE
ncbi:MAG: excinuclease ABC subunit UvrC [Acidobacteria bacterium]|nr:excinuclease ABC subunit UvrC [Acidobacteriota bacterium]